MYQALKVKKKVEVVEELMEVNEVLLRESQ